MRGRLVLRLDGSEAPDRGGRRAALLPALLLALLAWPPAAPLQAQEAAGEARTAPPEGVTPEIELSIERGLRYLIDHQAEDGSWTGDQGSYPVAMTALSGVAFLSSGSTATRGPYAPVIRRAAAFLLKSRQEGLFSSNFETGAWNEPRPMYGHAFSMMFLAQMLGQEESLERQAEIRTALRQAVDLTIQAQSPAGGWYYYPHARDDEGTLTVTMMQGLRSCRDAGIHVPKAVIDLGVKYIADSVTPSGAVYYSRSSFRQQVRPGVTCASVVALWSAGRYEDPLLKRIVGYMDKNIHAQWNSYGSHATYVQYYLAQARFLLGGDRWSQFYKQEAQLLLNDQAEDGSWLTQEESMHGMGTVYSTSVALVILQLPYNRLPIFQR
jgi:hypothetical protein